MEHQALTQENQEKISFPIEQNLTSTDQVVEKSAERDDSKFVLDSNDEASREKYAQNITNQKTNKGENHVKKTPETKSPAGVKKSPLSSAEKKKNRTPPKSKYNSQQKSNGNQRGNHNKVNFNSNYLYR